MPGIMWMASSHMAHTFTSTVRKNHHRGVSAKPTIGRPSPNSRGAAAECTSRSGGSPNTSSVRATIRALSSSASPMSAVTDKHGVPPGDLRHQLGGLFE